MSGQPQCRDPSYARRRMASGSYLVRPSQRDATVVLSVVGGGAVASFMHYRLERAADGRVAILDVASPDPASHASLAALLDHCTRAADAGGLGVRLTACIPCSHEHL